MKPAVLALAALLSLPALAACAQPASAAEADAVFAATTVNLAAYGETKIAPDQATINLGVQSRAATAQEAMRLNNVAMNRVTAALRAQGVAERDIQTSGLNLNPQMQYAENQAPRVTGYEASNQVTVTVNDLARLGPTVDAVVAAGSNQINGIGFGLRDPKAAENAARQDAVRQLRAKADLYAQATGHKVRRLVSLNEGTSYSNPPPPRPYARMAMAEAASSDAANISPGELKVRVDVSATYELER
jgi:hypothetical protein